MYSVQSHWRAISPWRGVLAAWQLVHVSYAGLVSVPADLPSRQCLTGTVRDPLQGRRLQETALVGCCSDRHTPHCPSCRPAVSSLMHLCQCLAGVRELQCASSCQTKAFMHNRSHHLQWIALLGALYCCTHEPGNRHGMLLQSSP